jgi:hypothetical protein
MESTKKLDKIEENKDEMIPSNLNELSGRAQFKRNELGAFEYGNEDYEPGIQKEKRDMVVMQDGAQYIGEWNKATNMRHGRG